MPKRSVLPRSKRSLKKNVSTSASQRRGFDLNAILVAAGVTLGIVLLGLMMGWRLYTDGNASLRIAQVTDVSGEIVFTALQPDPGDAGELTLLVRRVGETQWQNTDLQLPLAERVGWTWSRALPGVHYEFMGVLYINGQDVEQTDEQFVTAPAHNVQMALSLTWPELPADVERPPTATLAGKVSISGYIPDKSELEIYSIPRGEEYEVEAVTPELLRNSEEIASLSVSEAEATWSWDQADPAATYELVAVVRHQNQIIGISLQQLTAGAGEKMLDFTINSTAAAPDQQAQVPTDESLLALGSAGGRVLGTTTAGKSTISGIVYVQGPEQPNTSLLMLWKNPGDANYQVIGRYPYPSQAGQVWTWNGAQAGQPYEIMAVLQVNNNNTSSAPTPITVNAPATNVNFTLNTWYVIPGTSSTPVFQTCLNRSGNNWTAQITVPPIQGAQQYWVRVGSAAGTGNIWNQQFSAGANNQNFTLRVPATENQQQFVQYTYATCDQCQGDDNFAPFSASVGFTCI